MPLNTEQSKVLGSKLMLPEEFDRRFNSDPNFASRVAGSTTMGSVYLLGGIEGNTFRVRKYGRGHLYVALVDQAAEALGVWRSDVSKHNFDCIQSSREHAFGWITSEVYKQFTGNPMTNRQFDDYIFYLFNYGTPRNPHVIPETFDQFAKLMYNRLFSDPLLEEIRTALPELFESPDQLKTYLELVKQRKGVQAIYSIELVDFIRRLQDDKWREDHADTTTNIIVCEDIPGDLVRYVLPLGDYEQKFFGI